MLFDCDPKLIRTLMRESKVGLRDLTIKLKMLGPNEVTYVGAKTMHGVNFLKKIEDKVPKIVLDFEPEDEDEEAEDEDADELEEEEEEDDLEEEDEDEDLDEDELADD